MSTVPPVANTTPEQRLHPWSWLFVLIQSLKQFVFPLILLAFFGSRNNAEGIIGFVVPLCAVVILAVLSVWRYFTYRYQIDAETLTIRSGLLQRNLRQIPFTRIHNVTIHRTLLHRIFNVAEVQLESAGSADAEAQMRVLSLDQALALENLIRRRSEQAVTSTDSAVGVTPEVSLDTAEGKQLLSLSVGEIIRLGIISNRGMVVIAAALGLAYQIFPAALIQRFFIQSIEMVFTNIDIAHSERSIVLVSILALLIVATIVSRVFSIGLALLSHYGFDLRENEQRLTVESGLFTRMRASVPRRRIQSWTMRESLLQRLFRRRSLSVETAVLDNKKNQQRTLKDLVPIATAQHCNELIKHLLNEACWIPTLAWQSLPKQCWWRLFIGQALFFTLVSVLLAKFWHVSGLVLLAWLPISAVNCWQQARNLGYAIDTHLIVIRGGWWSRYWRFVEIDKLQVVQLQYTPLDHCLGTVTLWLDTAGASALTPSLRIRFLPQVIAKPLYEQLSHTLANRRLRW